MSTKRKFSDDTNFNTPTKKLSLETCISNTPQHILTGSFAEDELKEQLATLTSKINIYKEKAKKAEDEHQKKVKYLEGTLQSKIDERDKLINNLQLFIDEQEARHKHTLDERGGEDAEVTFNFTNPLHRLTSQIKLLQSEKCQLIEKNSLLEMELEDWKSKFSNLEGTLKIDYVGLSEYKLLESELEVLRQKQIDLKKKTIIGKENLTPTLQPDTPEQIGSTRKAVKDLRNELKTKEREHFDSITKLREENHSIRKKLSESLNNYTNLAFTPPKTIVKEVTDAETEQELDELKSERIDLKWKLKSMARELEKKEQEIEVLGVQVKESKEKEDTLVEELKSLQDCIQNLRSEISDSKTQHIKAIAEKDNELLTFKEKLDIKEQQIAAEIFKIKTESERKSGATGIVGDELRRLGSCLKEFRLFKNDVASQLTHMKSFYCNSLASFKTSLKDVLQTTAKENSFLLQNYRKEMTLRKKLHNQLVELKGNIRVYCRVRPFISEDGPSSSNVVTFNAMDDSLVYVDHKSSKKKFELDKVFPPEAKQVDVFEEVRPLIESCLDGFNVSIFAYGQTGSGKTFTMEGTMDEPGLNQQTLRLLFDCSSKKSDWMRTVHVSFVEIYNETLVDLLSEDCVKLTIKQGNDGVFVPGLTQIEVKGLSDVNEVFTLGRRNRTVASTTMNERSSRSHSVLTISVVGNNVTTGASTSAKLNLVDLAGSERVSKSGSEGLRMKEAQSINKSLSALGDVIHSLKNKNHHIPYRNSKLTYLLQESLSADSKTLMMVQVSPADKNSSETFCSLDFAQRVRSVELGRAKCSANTN